MPLKSYDTKESVPAEQQAAAIETKDGKWLVEEADPDLGEKGKKALQDERDARKVEKEKREAAERERDELKRTVDAHKAGISEDELKKIRDAEAAARKPIEDKLAETEAARAAVETENRKLKLTDRVQRMALDKGVMPDRIEDAMMLLDKRTELGDQDGIVFKDKDGKITTDTAETFFPKFKTEKPWLFKGTGGAGGVEGDLPTPIVPVPQGGHSAIGGKF